jgi:hypothetical protein
MKTYILRNSKAVEPQTKSPQARPQRGIQSAPPASPIPAQPAASANGLDVHTDSIAVSLAPSDSTEVRRYGMIGGGTHDDVLRRVKKLQAAHPGGALRFCYEARPARLSAVPLAPQSRAGVHPRRALEDSAQAGRPCQNQPPQRRPARAPLPGR